MTGFLLAGYVKVIPVPAMPAVVPEQIKALKMTVMGR